MKRRLLPLLLTFALIMSLSVTTGSASELPAEQKTGITDWANFSGFSNNGTYYINSVEDLMAFRDIINQDANSYQWSCSFYLTTDIVLNESSAFRYTQGGYVDGAASGQTVNKWTAIGSTYGTPFKGTFYGQGHTISGLYTYVDSYTTEYGGLFGYVSSGKIYDVNVANAYIDNHGGNSGGIVGALQSGTVENCSFQGRIYANNRSTSYPAGGIAGSAEGICTINSCTASASVTSYLAGGIVGTVTHSNTTIRNCVSAGKVTGLGNTARVGGIVGRAVPCTIENCGSSCDIWGGGMTGTQAGGIVGTFFTSSVQGGLENCWFAGTIDEAAIHAGVAVMAEGAESYVTIANAYSAYGAANFVYQSENPVYQYEDSSGGCGKFYLRDAAGSQALTVVTTDHSGHSGGWDTSVTPSVFYQTPDTRYVQSRRTDLITALNAWVADHSADSYQLWCLGVDGLPRPMDGTWAAAADTTLDVGGDTIEISTAAQLAQLAALTNSGVSFAGKTVLLTDSVDLNGALWTSIGTSKAPFDGDFDGAGHTISGLAVIDGAHSGLFGAATGSLANIRVTASVVSGTNMVGGIVGSTTGPVTGCSFDGAVYGASNVGGIAGSAAVITNSRNGGIVCGSGTVGAVCGSGDLGNCFSTGTVHGTAALELLSLSAADVTDPFDFSACQGDLTGSGEADNSYDAAAVTEENANALFAALDAGAEANADYTPWTTAAAANSGLPYYAAFSGGTGTAADPYRITTMDQLIFLASEATAGKTQADISFLLENDISHNEGTFDAQGIWRDGNGDPQEGILVEWTPIAGFDGSFDGGGHTISGIYSPSGPLIDTTLGSVKNLMLTDCYFADAALAGAAENCGSTCASGAIAGDNCWSVSAAPDPAALNDWVRENGPGYCRWYAIPGSEAVSFVPAALSIQFRLEGGTAADASAVFHYGEPLLTIAEPLRSGYDFAGWSVYLDERAVPAAVYQKDVTGIGTDGAETVLLQANWALSGASLDSFGTIADGILILGSDVVLADTCEIREDLVIDLAGHSIGGSSETALFTVNGCSLTFRNSGDASDISTNRQIAIGAGSQVILPGTASAEDASATVSTDPEAYMLTAFPLEKDTPGSAILAAYDGTGKMTAVSFIGSGKTATVSVELTAQAVETASRLRCFILPPAWLT